MTCRVRTPAFSLVFTVSFVRRKFIVTDKDDLFHRLETVHFSVLLLVRVTWRTRAEVIQNPEALRLEYCPDCHLAQISLRRGAGEHFLHCDGSLKGLVITRV
jgi:hypothetical protein